MFAVESYNQFDSSLNNVKAVVAFEWIYECVRKQMGKIVVLLVIFFLALPIVFLFGYWLKLKRKKFQKHMRTEMPLFKHHSDYVKFKQYIDSLDQLMPSLNKVNGYSVKNAPLFLKYTLKQMQRMTSTVVTYKSWLKKRLACLNEEQFTSETKVFTLVSENELWKNRNQAYQYWM